MSKTKITNLQNIQSRKNLFTTFIILSNQPLETISQLSQIKHVILKQVLVRGVIWGGRHPPKKKKKRKKERKKEKREKKEKKEKKKGNYE